MRQIRRDVDRLARAREWGRVERPERLLRGAAYLAWQTDAAGTHRSAKKLAKAVAEFQTSIEKNVGDILNDGERYRNGEAISSAIAESAVNQVISTRLVKQQMRLSPEGAHLLLQVRTHVRNDDRRGTFRRWYSALAAPPDREALAAWPPPVFERSPMRSGSTPWGSG